MDAPIPPSESVAGQGPAASPTEKRVPALKTGEYFSHALGRRQVYGWFAPEPAGFGRRTPLLILLHGLNGAWQDWSRYTRIARYLAGTDLTVVFPDGGDGWYTNGIDESERREDDIMQDLLPHLESAMPLLPGARRAIGGLSMGGYGAAKLALKYPEQFRLAVSHSGALEISARPAVHSVFGDPQANATFRRRESVFWLAEQAMCRIPTERPLLFLDCGASDPLAGANRHFSEHLNYLGYGHVYRELPGHHTWPYWDRALRTVLPEIHRLLGIDPPGSTCLSTNADARRAQGGSRDS